jgi:hypothetical protein
VLQTELAAGLGKLARALSRAIIGQQGAEAEAKEAGNLRALEQNQDSYTHRRFYE